MGEFRMPSLGADMEFGTLVRWRVKAGDAVRRGDIIAEVETEKGVIEVEVFEAGTVESLVVGEGTKVPVGTVLARVRSAESSAAARPVLPARPVAAAPAPTSAQPVVTAPPELPASPVRASPAARTLAAERGVDIAHLGGTGPEGVVTLADVERAATPAPERTAAERQSSMRRAIAAAMSRSNREIPHYYLAADISVHRTMEWLGVHNATLAVRDRVLPVALLLKAAALALHEVPELNGFWVDNTFVPSSAVHLGVAIALRGGGLFAPAIHDADRLTPNDLMRTLRDLVQRTRNGGLRGSELTDATITVTNLGDLGVESVFGVIYPPQVALVGFGRITERARAERGQLAARHSVTATLAGDHRASDGHRGGLYLAAVERLLQKPEDL